MAAKKKTGARDRDRGREIADLIRSAPDDQIGEVCLAFAEQKVRETASGRDVLWAIAICVDHHLIIPEWLAREYGRRYAAGALCEVSSWDDERAFGKPQPRYTNVRARRKALEKKVAVYLNVVTQHEGGRSITKQLFADVGAKHNIGATLAEELYYNLKNTIRSNPAKS